MAPPVGGATSSHFCTTFTGAGPLPPTQTVAATDGGNVWGGEVYMPGVEPLQSEA